MSSQSLQSAKLKITLEEVLRLKRREKPSAEFWELFDRELRQKTLRALVDEKPWHQKYITPVFGRLAIALPLATAAVLALAFTVFQDGIPFGAPAPKAVDVPIVNKSFNRRDILSTKSAGHSATVSMPYTTSSLMVYTQVSFVVNLIPLPSNSQRAFDTVMTPQTLTASAGTGNLYQGQGDSMADAAAPLVKFVSAPTLDYF